MAIVVRFDTPLGVPHEPPRPSEDVLVAAREFGCEAYFDLEDVILVRGDGMYKHIASTYPLTGDDLRNILRDA